MVKRLLAAMLFLLAALAFSQPAFAANQQPPDVPNPVLQVVNGIATYAPGTTLNVLGNGTATSPDTPPYFASMPADIATTNRTQWIDLTDTTATFENFACSNIGVSCEAKFRSHLNVNHPLYDDPVRNYGEPGTSHCHEFFGNMAVNAFSTYASLRTRNEARAGGGRLNGTGYWAPCPIKVNPFGDGKNYAVKMSIAALYYVNDNSMSPWLIRLPRGLRYVGGTNMDDPEDTTRKRSVILANAQTGTAGRYQYFGNGFNGWQCITGDGAQASPTLVPHLKNPDGSDPFGGTCTVGTGANAGKPAIIIADFDGPSCWDGINPWAPGGYDNVRYGVRDTQLNAARGQTACPDHWYHIPAIRLELNYPSHGFADYGNWRLSSDDGMQSKLNSLPTCTTDAAGAYANAPCATHSGPYWNGTSYVIPNGASFHTDWFGGWDDETMRTWMANCTGVQGLVDGSGNPIPSTPHTCSSSTIASGKIMKSGTPPDSSHNPIMDMQANSNPLYDTSTPTGMFQVRTVAPSGMHTYHSM